MPMSSSDSQEFAELAQRALEISERVLENDATEEISDETVQKLLTAGARLFSRKTELEERFFLPFISKQACTATDICQTACEMLRATDLNIFDLAMWYSRARPEDEN